MDILSFYTSLLTAAGLKVNEAGDVLLKLPEGTAPLTIQGQRLVLPTNDILKEGVGEERIAFHPVSEGLARKESPVLKRYRKVLQYQLNWVMAELMSQLMDIAVDTDRHTKLSPAQGQFLKLLPDVNKKTSDALTKVLRKVDNERVDRRLISVYIKRPGLLNGREYPRVAVVTFPILDCLKDKEPTIFDVKMRRDDKDAIVNLFLHILPKADEVNAYSFGTTDLVAPNLYSLAMAAASIGEKINDKVALYGDQLEDADDLRFDVSYVSGLDSMAKFRALVPEQHGNVGDKLDGREDDAEDVSTAVSVEVKKERERPIIGFPPPDKERPQPTQPVNKPGVSAAQIPEARPQTTAEPVRKNTWRDQLVPQHQPAPPAHYPPPGYHQPPQGYHTQSVAPHGYYAPPPPPGYHPPQQGYYQPAPPPPGTGTYGRNMVEQQRQMQYQANAGMVPSGYYAPPTHPQPQYHPSYPGGPQYGSPYYR